MDSFKGSLSSLEAGEAAAEGIRKVCPEAQICVRPLADGGEGTVDAITRGLGGEIIKTAVTGPLGKLTESEYGILPEAVSAGKKKTAVLEMAKAAGIMLIKPEERNPFSATTYGVGELIRDAVRRGCRHFLIGIGGSATNDGGAGMLQALGFGLLDGEGKQIPPGARGLSRLTCITEDGVMPELRECSFRIACDVSNPLCGPKGCSAVFGPQKGADEDRIRQMDQWLEAYAQLVCRNYPKADPDCPGAGAAGGLGFAFLAFTNAVLESGIKIVLEETHLEEEIRNADIIVTGEGRMDGQTAMGKAPAGVAKLAKKYEKTVIGFCGCVGAAASVCNEKGIDAYFPILREPVSLQEAMKSETARRNLEQTVQQVFRLIGTQRGRRS